MEGTGPKKYREKNERWSEETKTWDINARIQKETRIKENIMNGGNEGGVKCYENNDERMQLEKEVNEKEHMIKKNKILMREQDQKNKEREWTWESITKKNYTKAKKDNE